MKQIFITEEQLHEIVATANADITGKLVNDGKVNPIEGLRLTLRVYRVITRVCDHLFREGVKNV